MFTVLGYNPIITIPAGATNINVTEIHKSKNYLGESNSINGVVYHVAITSRTVARVGEV